ncbi:hypothetical protein CVIRNUC_003202 [Coccomyxa viridis]|uniref:NADH:flavin oxidoreductase/NADH oxidase N-terminal domain-containing protein n=1 Tax=Coccomyxa viridis TaxID=1274662 RepID=A0AAV1I155_9CHLO|nr:hypothetical protein CVIRNUC_003202 [Coccomyxa viridis]
MLTEATVIAPEGHGYPHTPGIYTQEQIDAWKPVVEAVKAKGTVFFLQLWHTGRASHQDYQPNGKAPMSSSALAASGTVYTPKGAKEYPVPRAMTTEEIARVVDEFRQAARNSLDAGFDGVEIHSANGYILDQFLKESVNKRTDQYGGSIANRCRFTLEVVDAVAAEVGGDRVGIRISPFGGFLDADDSHPYALHTYLLEELNKRDIAYVHFIEPRDPSSKGVGSPLAVHDWQHKEHNLDVFRHAYKGTFIAAGGHTRNSGIEALEKNHADLICYGRIYLANPDLVHRFAIDAPLNKYDRDTFYIQDQVVGYTDYPSLDEVENSKKA